MRKSVLWTAIVVVGLLLISGIASADKPAKDEFYFDGTSTEYVYVSCDDVEGDLFLGNFPVPCENNPEIKVCERADALLTSKSFFDKEGNLIRYREKGSFTGSFYEYGNYDNRLDYGPVKGASFLIDFGDPATEEDDTYTWRGLQIKIVVPGYGNFFMDAGRFTAGGVQGGKHPYFNGEYGPICEYLEAYYD